MAMMQRMRVRWFGITLGVLGVLAFLPFPTHAAPMELDTDADGWSDVEEVRMGMNPESPDSDGDGYRDGVEIAHGYDPNDARPERLEKRIVITLATQQLEYSLGPYDLGAYVVSTGKRSTPTPKGTFQIATKQPRAWSSRAGLWMPFWMNFTGPRAPVGLYGIHELPEWRGGRKEGASHLGTPVSGGCVRLAVGAAKTLYDWAEVGTTVIIQ